VVRDIHASYPDVRTEVVAINLSSLKSVRKAAQHVKKIVGEGGIDILFNNAGINISERKLTDEGIEMQFGTNHVGPFLFTNLLLPLLLRPSTASSHSSPKLQKRIINTSSEAHRISPVRFSDWSLDPEKAARGEVEREDEPRRGLPKGVLRGGGVYEPAIAYGQSKSANVLFVIGLNERLLRGEGDRVVKSFAVMPGSEHLVYLTFRCK
jgi:NAD(P)-dependent dehydrogenase (short-subunit alcohol dehydrogenase family)